MRSFQLLPLIVQNIEDIMAQADKNQISPNIKKVYYV